MICNFWNLKHQVCLLDFIIPKAKWKCNFCYLKQFWLLMLHESAHWLITFLTWIFDSRILTQFYCTCKSDALSFMYNSSSDWFRMLICLHMQKMSQIQFVLYLCSKIISYFFCIQKPILKLTSYWNNQQSRILNKTVLFSNSSLLVFSVDWIFLINMFCIVKTVWTSCLTWCHR